MLLILHANQAEKWNRYTNGSIATLRWVIIVIALRCLKHYVLAFRSYLFNKIPKVGLTNNIEICFRIIFFELRGSSHFLFFPFEFKC